LDLIDKIRSLPELTREYRHQASRALTDHPGSVTRESLRSFYWPWLLSVCLNRDTITPARPWITYPAARFLETLLTRECRVFEYGAGGSTLFFSKRVGELVTVEHDRLWLERTAARMRRRGGVRWQPQLHEPVAAAAPRRLPASDPEAYASTAPEYEGMSFQGYATAIEPYADNYFDIVLIDGRARPSCFRHAIAKVKFGGYVVLDNAEREQYAWVEETAEKLGFEKREFWGPGPYNRYFWRTIFLRKVRERFALNELDAKLERHLDLDRGTFVEAGANDGIAQSNTLYFEAKRGWRGLLIEPEPRLAEQCRRYRPRAVVEAVALVPAEHRGPVVLRYANLMSMVKGAMPTREEEDAHIAKGCEVQKIETYEVSVPAATLSSLLDKHGLRQVDLLSLDVEGYELSALQGLDLSRHRPRFILVEARYRDEVHAHLSGLYDLVEQLSFHDLLYRLRNA
jgi:FkbM family methyltransferase